MGAVVGEVGSLLGASPNNSKFTAQSPNLLQPINQFGAAQQSATGYAQGEQGVLQQQALNQQLAAQNGLGNQSSVFNQLQGVANGTGVNPAQAMLNNQTGNNIANQAALMAGQRGTNANAGLLARQIAQQGAATQQNAVGQGAALQANQSLNALGQLGSLANQQVAQQQLGLNAYNQANLAQQNALQNTVGGYNQNLISNASQANNANQSMAGVNANNSAKAIGGLTNGFGAGFMGGGGGGAAGASGASAGGSLLGAAALAYTGGRLEKDGVQTATGFKGKMEPHVEHMARIFHPHKFSEGGKVDALVSPGEVYLSPKQAKDVAKDGKNPIKEGSKVPGKAKVKGDSPENDTVPAKLDVGGVVIPKSVMESNDPAGNAAKFVAQLIKKQGDGKDHESDFKKALKGALKGKK